MGAASQFTVKQHRCGTHRVVPPETTLQRIEPLLTRFGITRVAPVTGLDVVGIPTVMAVRPLSRNLSVAQGKGLTLTAARVSGIMEAIEQAVAEDIRTLRLYGSARELKRLGRIARVDRLLRGPLAFDADAQIFWLQAKDLSSGEPVLCPYEVVHLDLRVPEPPGAGYFSVDSNGLASGNDALEATCHALFELIERDATARFYRMAPSEQVARRVRLSSVSDADCLALLERYQRAGVDVAVWEITSPLGVAAFLCDVLDRPEHALRGLSRARGMGCHSQREIALCRALCEAAQSRLTLISGARDDIAGDELQLARGERNLSEARSQLTQTGTRDYEAAPSTSFDSFQAELGWLLHKLAAYGCDEVLQLGLQPDGELPLAVVRVVVPGLLAPLPKAEVAA